MNENEFQKLLNKTQNIRQEDMEQTELWRSRIVSEMIKTARKESDRIEHHLLEMPLSVIIYQWIVIRLKCRPWRLLIPASLLLSILLQGLLSRINILQLLVK